MKGGVYARKKNRKRESKENLQNKKGVARSFLKAIRICHNNTSKATERLTRLKCFQKINAGKALISNKINKEYLKTPIMLFM